MFKLHHAPIAVIDFETFSEVDLKAAGAWRYAEDESTEPLCMTYANGNDESEVKLWLPENNTPKFLSNPKMYFVAHNAEFEIAIWKHVMTPKYNWPECPPLERWIDTMAVCSYYTYPAKLEKACESLGLSHQKDMRGHRVMLKLSKPRKPSKHNPATRWTKEAVPEDYETLYKYGIDDTAAERELLQTLGILPQREQLVWQMNMELNMKGVPVDRELAIEVLKLKDFHNDNANKEITKLTKGQVTKTTQTARIAKLLKVKSLAREILERMEKSEKHPKRKRLMQLRLDGARTSTAKYVTLLAAEMKDGFLRGLQMYHAATTGRFGGRLIQPHNLPRPKLKLDLEQGIDEVTPMVKLILNKKLSLAERYKRVRKKHKDIMQVFSSLVRSAILAPKGYRFVVLDFANIEARVLAWMANEIVALKQYRDGVDVYLEMATEIYGRKITKKDHFERQLGKQCVLGAGYGMGYKTFMATCLSYNMEVTEELAEKAIKAYRKLYPSIKQYWYDINDAALEAIRTNEIIKVNNIEFEIIHSPIYALRCKLPSGKFLYYPEPYIATVPAPWNSDQEIQQMFFMGRDSQTGQWVEQSTYGGKIVENIVQATARELLIEAWYKSRKRKLPIILTVHDELIALVKKLKAKKAYRLMLKIMKTVPKWGYGIPMDADGYIDKRYKKG